LLDHAQGRIVLNAFSKSRQSGFTLIEMMISVVILGILLAIAVPSFRVMLLNAQISNAAESIQNGILYARSEAIRRGDTTVEFVLLPVAANDQTSWIVQVPSAGDLLIEQRLSNEGSPNVTRVVTGGDTITFDSTGSPLATNADGSARLEKVELDLDPDVLAADQTGELEVNIDFGGKVRMCDRNVSPPNPRACD
jgi:type IV fimbrial biogenesis protein FimT